MNGGDRHNGFGARMGGQARQYTRSLELTRAAVAAQAPEASFGTTPPATEQRVCGSCGAAMPAARLRCRFCGGGAVSS